MFFWAAFSNKLCVILCLSHSFVKVAHAEIVDALTAKTAAQLRLSVELRAAVMTFVKVMKPSQPVMLTALNPKTFAQTSLVLRRASATLLGSATVPPGSAATLPRPTVLAAMTEMRAQLMMFVMGQGTALVVPPPRPPRLQRLVQ